MKPVKSKKDFVKRYMKGEFGNRAPTWDNLKDLKSERVLALDERMYHIRNRVAGGPTWYNIPGVDLEGKWNNQIEEWGIDPATLYISEMAPTQETTIQGEVQRTTWGLYLRYTRVAKPMREAFTKEDRSIMNLKASALMVLFMNASSYDWVEQLLEIYPDHVIEFSCYGKCWGTIPGMNTVIWEVRNY